jgi:hypothetical protein
VLVFLCLYGIIFSIHTKEAHTMKCPYCGNEMELGYIQCRDGVRWTEKRAVVAAFSALAKGSLPLGNGAADNSDTVYAHKCADCKKVIIDYAN